MRCSDNIGNNRMVTDVKSIGRAFYPAGVLKIQLTKGLVNNYLILFLLLGISFFSSLWAGTTPLATVQDYYSISDEFDREFKDFTAFKDFDEYTEHYRAILERLYRATISGQLLEAYMESLHSIQINSSAGAYLFPFIPQNVYSKRLITQDESSAIVEYSVVEERDWSSLMDFVLEDGHYLKTIYREYNILNPPFNKVFRELNDIERNADMGFAYYKIYVTSPAKITFLLNKSGSSGWRIHSIGHLYHGSTLSWKEWK